MAKSLGDSGTFGSQKTMNAIGKMQQANKAKSGSNLFKGQLTGKLPAYKKGGKVKKTGPALVHKGEVVVPKNKVKKLKKAKTGIQMLMKATKGKK